MMLVVVSVLSVVLAVIMVGLVLAYGIRGYFRVQEKELSLREREAELKHPTNQAVSLEKFTDLQNRVVKLEEQVRPLAVMQANKQIFGRR